MPNAITFTGCASNPQLRLHKDAQMPTARKSRRHSFRVFLTFEKPEPRDMALETLQELLEEGNCALSNTTAYLSCMFPEIELDSELLDVSVKEKG